MVLCADQPLFIFASVDLTVQPGVTQAAEDTADHRTGWRAPCKEVVAGEVGAFVAGFREVVEEAVADGVVGGEGGGGPEGWEGEGGEYFDEGAALEVGIAERGGLKAGALSHRGEGGRGRGQRLERGHRLEGGALRARQGEAAGKGGGFGFGKAPGEDGPVGGAGAIGVEALEAGEGGGMRPLEAKGGVGGGKSAAVVERAEGFFWRTFGQDAGKLVVEAGAADGVEVRDVSLDPG